MKKTYTKKQIIEAITYWKKILKLNRVADKNHILRPDVEFRSCNTQYTDEKHLISYPVKTMNESVNQFQIVIEIKNNNNIERRLISEYDLYDGNRNAVPITVNSFQKGIKVIRLVLFSEYADHVFTAAKNIDTMTGEYYLDINGGYEFMKVIPAGTFDSNRRYCEAI